jgi:hypothetical protein
MTARDRKKQRFYAVLAAAGVLCLLLAWAVWIFWPEGNRQQIVTIEEKPPALPARPVKFGDQTLKAVDLPVALLFDCYENALENVPPRTDTSYRQWSWEAPPLPMDVARGKLRKAGASENDRKILAWLEDWEGAWNQDYPTTTDQLWKLEPLLDKDAMLDFKTLMKIGISMSFLDGDEHAAAWIKAGMSKVIAETASLRPGDLPTNDYLGLMAQTRALWQRREFGALASRFEAERRLFPSQSRGARKAGDLLAEQLNYLGRSKEAVRVVLLVQEENERIGDLAESDRFEMHWEMGNFMFHAGDYERAPEHLRHIVRSATHPHRNEAMRLLAISLARTGGLTEAEEVAQRWREEYRPPSVDVMSVSAFLEEAKASTVSNKQ